MSNYGVDKFEMYVIIISNMDNIEREVPRRGLYTSQIATKQSCLVMQGVGEKHGVAVTIIAEEGQPYTHIEEDFHGRRSVFSSTVPEGKVYVRISSANFDIHDFWQEVHTSLKNQDSQ